MWGIYSICYDGWEEGDDSYSAYAIDWNWRVYGEWARSDMGGPGTPWLTTQGLDDKAYKALLEHFGLQDYSEEFPKEKIITMSPAKLAAARREKEKLHGLEKIKMANDTIGLGCGCPAEMYE
jgi:hypothetical protein